MIVASWNVNSITARLSHVLGFLESASPDLLCLQELKCVDEKFPLAEIEKLGYHCLLNGEKTYNGVAILSKGRPAELVSKVLPGCPEPVQSRLIEAKVEDIYLLNLYVPNGSEVGSAKYEYKLLWFEALLKYINENHKPTDKLIVVGDFNIAPEDRDVHKPEEWVGSVLVSEKERELFKRIIAFPLIDTFRVFEQDKGHYSWWDYRMMAFRRNNGLRIDHILITEPLQANLKRSWIDKEVRKLEKPSDHAPVLIELDLS
ncbi:MAG: exodeoxyribonuclease III [Cyanobacteria bacterium SZAS LIN-2]|nr:exodeoxyribonuclease III [Cyanobacteria bacterium SZAS LIN-2]